LNTRNNVIQCRTKYWFQWCKKVIFHKKSTYTSCILRQQCVTRIRNDWKYINLLLKFGKICKL